MRLFEPAKPRGGRKQPAPLADRMRPQSLDEFLGQEHLVGPAGREMKRRCASGLRTGLIILLLLPLPAGGQARFQAELVLTVPSNDRVVTAALSSDGRLAYAVEKSVVSGERRQKRAEVYLMSLAGKGKKRFVRYEAMPDPANPRRLLAFSVERLEWSPDASKLAVEISDRGATAVFLFNSNGDPVELPNGANSVRGYGAKWLADNSSLGVLEEAASPRLLHQVLAVRVEAGRAISLFPPRTFAAVAWVPGRMQAVLVEQDKGFARPPHLVVGDLTSGEVSDLGPEPDYVGGLRATSDGERFSYFVGQRKLLLRKLAGDVVGSIALPFARYEWLGTGGAVVFLEPEKLGLPTGWLAVWNPETKAHERLLPEERIADFWVAPDGFHVAVLTAEEVPTLKVYRVQAQSP